MFLLEERVHNSSPFTTPFYGATPPYQGAGRVTQRKFLPEIGVLPSSTSGDRTNAPDFPCTVILYVGVARTGASIGGLSPNAKNCPLGQGGGNGQGQTKSNDVARWSPASLGTVPGETKDKLYYIQLGRRGR